MNKRIIVYLLVVFLLAGSAFGLFYFSHTQSPSKEVLGQETLIPSVQCIFSKNGEVLFGQTVSASTVFEALQRTAEKNNLPLRTKQYDFGIFVEGVGDMVSTKDMAWMYYVNGVSGTVAADKHMLKNGDSVEWKYETVSF